MLTKERKKQLDTDLWIIAGVSLLVLVIYTVFGREIDNIAVDTEIPIVLRVLFMGGIFQFGIAGLGITIVAIVRKERFSDHGLTRKHLLPAIALSALCCVPDLLYNLFAGNVHTWLPISAWSGENATGGADGFLWRGCATTPARSAGQQGLGKALPNKFPARGKTAELRILAPW